MTASFEHSIQRVLISSMADTPPIEIKTEFHASGRLRSRAEYLSDKKHGLCEVWNKQGRKICKSNFAHGMLHGLHEVLNCEGLLRRRQNYEWGQQSGLRETFHQNGQLRDREHYSDGKMHGSCERWGTNGQLRARCNYAAGELHGVHVEVNRDLNVTVNIRYYDRNKIISHETYQSQIKMMGVIILEICALAEKNLGVIVAQYCDFLPNFPSDSRG